MTAQIIDGRAIADEIRAELQAKVRALRERGVTPGIAFVLVGWRYVFAPLAVGPVFGIWSMVRLRARPEAVRMASGNR